MHTLIYCSDPDDKVITYGFYSFDWGSELLKMIEDGKEPFYDRMTTHTMIVNKVKKTIRVEWEWNIEKKEFGNSTWKI